MLPEVNHMGKVTPLIVIPVNKLYKLWFEHDISTSIKYVGSVVTLKFSGHKGLITVSK